MPHDTIIKVKPDLPQITLLAITSVAIEATVAALKTSLAQFKFGCALLLSDREPQDLCDGDIKWIKIRRLNSRKEYSEFILYDLINYVSTEYALIVQWDGFIRSSGIWDKKFLEFDYIGSPWLQYDDNLIVGNGGFSLRSRRLLEVCRFIPASSEPEDVAICRTHRNRLELNHDIKFADLDIARRFSYERGKSTGYEFGFHGVFNMPSELSVDTLMTILASLEPGVIGERESTEMLTRALRAGDWPLARLILRHHRAHPRHYRRLLRALRWLLLGQRGWQAPRPKVQ